MGLKYAPEFINFINFNFGFPLAFNGNNTAFYQRIPESPQLCEAGGGWETAIWDPPRVDNGFSVRPLIWPIFF